MATIIPLPSFGNYSKLVNSLIGGMVGSAVGAGLSWLAVKGIAVCTDGVGGRECELWGIPQADMVTFIVGGVTALVGSLFVHQSPPNAPK